MSKLRKYRKIAKKIYQVLPRYKQMSDEELQQQTKIFQEELAAGKTLTQLLPRTFAVAMEADRRVLGLEPYEVQVLGGLALFFGNIADATGN
jgi:preprotein translocase subunit SecA